MRSPIYIHRTSLISVVIILGKRFKLVEADAFTVDWSAFGTCI